MSRPIVPPHAMQTFSLSRPRGAAFWRKATCAEVDCERRARGWRTVLDTSTLAGAQSARWVTERSGRHYTLAEQGPVLTFTFPAGQDCFENHQRMIEREPLYLWRAGGQRQAVQHPRADLWVEHSQEELDKVRQDRKQA